MAEAAGGDRAAQEELLARYWPLIVQAVRARRHRMGRGQAGRDETQDLEQKAAIRVLGELGRHEWRGLSSFGAWIKKLSDLEVIDQHRHHSAKKRDAAQDAGLSQMERGPFPMGAIGPSMESRIDRQDRLDELLSRVQSLKPEYGSALIMHHLGFSHAEIGEALGCTTEAARKLVSRARIRLLGGMDGP